ncbi:MAG: hypothetical protein AAFY03_13895, partial [Pseudomonadota bacterium]
MINATLMNCLFARFSLSFCCALFIAYCDARKRASHQTRLRLATTDSDTGAGRTGMTAVIFDLDGTLADTSGD